MKKKLLSLLLVFSMILTGCLDEDAPKPSEKPNEEPQEKSVDIDSLEGTDGSWAIYWYLCGSDLESDSGCATADLSEMMDVKLPENVKIVIQTGGAAAWQNEVISKKKICRYEYSGEEFKQIDELKQANMGDEKTLEGFLEFCNENYPADHKVALFWDHGGGTPSGVAQDENYDGDTLLLPEIRKAFENTCEVSESDPPYDMICFDTCLMATVDVANIFKDVGRYLVASEETEPGTGWTYNKWLKSLAKNTAIHPAELGKIICDTFYDECKKYAIDDSVTLSVTDLSKIEPVLEAYGKFGDEALVNLMNTDSFAGEFSRAAKKSENYGGNTKKSGYSDMADMGDLAKQTAQILPESSKAVLDAISDAVIYQIKGKYKSHANGLSCFVNYSHDEELLEKYVDAAGTESFKHYYTFNLTNSLDQKGLDYVSGLLNGGEIRPKEKFNISSLENKKIKISDNTAVLNIGKKNASNLSAVNLELYMLLDGGETILCLGTLGTAEDIDADWENGVFKENYRGVWGAIDGEPVYMEAVSSNDEYTLYQVPVKLNKKEMFLSVACDTATHEYTILGATKGLENGVASKEIIKLKKGDKITPILYAGGLYSDDVEEIEMDTVKVTSKTQFTEQELGDGKYAMNFEMVGNDGKSATSEIEMFKVKKGVMKYL